MLERTHICEENSLKYTLVIMQAITGEKGLVF